MIVGDPVQLVTRAGRYGDAPVVHGLIASLDDDRAQVHWVDGLTSSVRIQFLRTLAPRHTMRLAILRIQDRRRIRAAIVDAAGSLSHRFAELDTPAAAHVASEFAAIAEQHRDAR